MNKGKYNIIGTQIDACDYAFVLQKIQTSIRKTSLLVSPLASHTLVQAHSDRKLSAVMQKFDLLVPDSQWIRHALWFLYEVSIPQRVYGPELMQQTCKLAERNHYSIMLYGSTEQTVQDLMSELTKQYPKLQIACAIPSVFRPLSVKEENALIETIFSEAPDILFVGLGSPLQEEFTVSIAAKLAKKKNLVIIPVGAAFDFFAKSKPQAPAWIGNIGFEWLFRLVCEPQRLWKRYLVDGVVFIVLILKQKIKQYQLQSSETKA